jgi:hypothetical protein
MALWPNSPLLLPNPPGHMSVAELNNTQVLLKAEAHKKITFALYSVTLLSRALITSTPVAFFVSLL